MKRLILTAGVAVISATKLIPAEPGIADATITYSEHIAPIFSEKCIECHRQGESAPFVLTDFASVKRRGRTILRVVEEGFMPPWHAVGGDLPIAGDRRLSAEEVRLIRNWVAQGRTEGDPEKLPPPREFAEGWPLGEPDMILTMEEGYDLPAEGPDIYRNFVLPTRLGKKRFLKAIDFRPSSPEVVHHAIFFFDTSGRARQVDAADSEPGFAEMPVGQGAGRQLGAWVPGTRPKPLPEGLAHSLEARGEFVLQIHFHLSGKKEREQSTIALYFDDEPPERSFTSIQLPPVFGAFSGIDLQPEAADVKISDSFLLPVDVRAFGVQPHAHYRGKSLRLEAELPDGSTLCLLNIPRWDMNWQEEYRFEEQVLLPRGTLLRSWVVWDNTSNNSGNPIVPPVRVRWGLESFDEMGSIDLLVVAAAGEKRRAAADMKVLREHYRDHLVWTAGGHVLEDDKLAIFGRLRRAAIDRLDTNDDGIFDAAERRVARSILDRKLKP